MGSPLRILHLDSGRDWRGGQRQVLLLAEGLRARGFEPLVVAAPDSPLLARLRARGVATSAIRMRGDLDLQAVRRVRRLARTWKPDVVHAHDARAHAVALAALIGKPTPLVVTRRVVFAPRGARVKYGRRVDRFIAISGAVRDALTAGGVADDRVSIVYSGVPAPPVVEPRDWRRECGWPADTVLCGVVGAMTAEKGVETLAAIAAALPPEARARARLVLLGGAAAGRCEVGGMATYRAGFVDEIHAAMAGLDVLWHPSSAEGLGTAVIDAMALGVPPIAFATGGLPELIDPAENGVLVPPGDVREFAAAAARLVYDSALRERLAAAGPARAAFFASERMVDGTANVYDVVLGVAGRGAP